VRKRFLLCYVRWAFIVCNEIVVLWVIWSIDVVTQGPIDLVVNFSAAMFVCQLDNLVMATGRVHNLKERFDDLENHKDDELALVELEKRRRMSENLVNNTLNSYEIEEDKAQAPLPLKADTTIG
jgi:hypothetical protein